MKKSIKRNYLYTVIYHVFSIITPLIVTPYVSRVLGSSGIGQYTYSYSIVSYFILLSSLGFNVYAQREIAREQGNRYKQSVLFWEIIIARLIPVILSILLYFLLILFVDFKHYSILLIILSINILATFFDISFFYQGNEDFGIIALKNVIIKVFGIILIFIFVKTENDVWIYCLCYSLSLIISNISLWTRVPKMIDRISFKELHIFKHFLPSIRLFVPTVAVSVYTILDKTLIGTLVPGTVETVLSDGSVVVKRIADIENGFYDQSEKLVKIVMPIITSLGTVMSPRNSKAVASGNKDEFNKNLISSVNFIFFLGIPIMFGLAAISNNFSPWFFGEGYEKVPHLIMMLSPLIIIIGIGNTIGIQYLLPLKKDRKYTIAIVCGAVANMIMNIILIPVLFSYGACIATLIAEMIVCTIMFVFVRKNLSIKLILCNNWKKIVSGLIMFIVVFFTSILLKPNIINTILLVFEGIAIYFLILLFMRDEFLIKATKQFTNKLKTKKSLNNK